MELCQNFRMLDDDSIPWEWVYAFPTYGFGADGFAKVDSGFHSKPPFALAVDFNPFPAWLISDFPVLVEA